MRRTVAVCLAVLGLLGAVACGDAEPATRGGDDCPDGAPQRIVPRVHRTIPHDTGAFTQGLVVHDGRLYESTGREGSSTLRELDAGTGEVLRRTPLAADVFGEGLAVGAEGRLVQLTWTEEVAYEWDPAAFAVVREHTYEGEGWGLTTLGDGTLVMSDGSDTLVERDPADFSVRRSIEVRREGGDADLLNELEWDGELVWANRYTTDEVVGIDLRCAAVTKVLDVSDLAADADRRAGAGDPVPDVSNGIAHLPGTDRYLLTGKLWPSMYEVSFVPAERGAPPGT